MGSEMCIRDSTGASESDYVLLNWETAQEFENEGFFIERSTDGRNFMALDFIEGNGTTDVAQRYSFRDTDPKLKLGGTYYYRLRQLDRNGEEHYACAIIAVQINSDKEMALNVYPNPSSTVINLALYSLQKQNNLTIALYNVLGREVLRKEMSVEVGNQTIRLDVDDFIPGTYVLRCTNGQEIDISQTVVIVK